MTLRDLTSHALMSQTDELLRRERRIVVAFLEHLSEIDRRRLHVDMGYATLFLFCTKRLKLSNGTAWRRATAVELIQRVPIICEYLLDNRLSLASLGVLRNVLGGDDAVQILDRAAGMTEAEARELVVALQPKPIPRDVIPKVGEQLDLLAAAAAPPAQPAPTPAPAPAPTSNLEPAPAPKLVARVGHLLRVHRDAKDELHARTIGGISPRRCRSRSRTCR